MSLTLFVSEALWLKCFDTLEPFCVSLEKKEKTQAASFVINYFFGEDFAL